MALLQISEPGESPDPHPRRHAVGIDLGTTHSLVAAVRNGVAECLPDAEGRVILPSAVRYLSGGTAPVGHGPWPGRSSDPKNTIVSVKRLMGRGLDDIAAAAAAATTSSRRARAWSGCARAAGVKSPVEVSARSCDLAPARRGHLRRRARRRRHHRAGLLRRRAAPGDQGRGRARRSQRAAPAQRADGGGARLRPRQGSEGLSPSTISAAAPSTSRSCA